MTKNDAFEYEIAGSRWASLVSWNWLQDFAGLYYSKKVIRKHKAYMKFLKTRLTHYS